MYLHGGLIGAAVKGATKSLASSATKSLTSAATKSLTSGVTKSFADAAIKSAGSNALQSALTGGASAVGGAVQTAAGGLSTFANAITSNLPQLLEVYSAFNATQAAANAATTGAPNAAQPPGGNVTASPLLPGQPTSTAIPTAAGFLTTPISIGGLSVPPWTLLAGGVGLLALVFMAQPKAGARR